MNTPILFLIFNRPDCTQKVFEKIKEQKPVKLFVAADGPRPSRSDEKEVCEQTRKIVTENIDWECDVKYLFREKNLGCGKAVKQAIDWFFENVPEGIILEDDCLPSKSFFPFCEQMLGKFREDKRIMMVSGLNVFGEWRSSEEDYFFTQGGIWGWATWQRAWELHTNFGELLNKGGSERAISNSLVSSKSVGLRMEQFKSASGGIVDTWDYQWLFTRLVNSGLSVNPSKNLIANIGFSQEATHTVTDSFFKETETSFELVFPLKENPFIVLDKEYEKKVLETYKKSKIETVWLKIKHKIKHLI